ncbi:MAG: hypothetical protein R2748_11900 [Bryobacterales bacterium]
MSKSFGVAAATRSKAGADSSEGGHSSGTIGAGCSTRMSRHPNLRPGQAQALEA